MPERSNLALDIQQKSPAKKGTSVPSLVARIYLSFACSYLKDVGAPTITEDCNTLADFEREVSRIKDECDEILAESRLRFGDVESSGEPRAASAAQEALPGGTGQKPTVKIEAHLKVSDAMTRDVKSIRRNDRLSVGDDLMKVGNFRHVVVLDDDTGDLVGVISHRDIFYGALGWSTGQGETAHQKSLESIPAKDVMNSDVITTSPDTPLAEACQVMIERKIGCLPVVGNRVLVGILTEGDLLAILSNAQYGST